MTNNTFAFTGRSFGKQASWKYWEGSERLKWARGKEMENVGATAEEGSLSCGQHHRVSVTDSS